MEWLFVWLINVREKALESWVSNLDLNPPSSFLETTSFVIWRKHFILSPNWWFCKSGSCHHVYTRLHNYDSSQQNALQDVKPYIMFYCQWCGILDQKRSYLSVIFRWNSRSWPNCWLLMIPTRFLEQSRSRFKCVLTLLDFHWCW